MAVLWIRGWQGRQKESGEISIRWGGFGGTTLTLAFHPQPTIAIATETRQKLLGRGRRSWRSGAAATPSPSVSGNIPPGIPFAPHGYTSPSLPGSCFSLSAASGAPSAEHRSRPCSQLLRSSERQQQTRRWPIHSWGQAGSGAAAASRRPEERAGGKGRGFPCAGSREEAAPGSPHGDPHLHAGSCREQGPARVNNCPTALGGMAALLLPMTPSTWGESLIPPLT